MNKKKQEKEKHEFALFVEYLSSFVDSIEPGDQLELSDEKLFHRISKVLRLNKDDACILFDRFIHVRFVIDEFVGKKEIRGTLHTKQNNTILKPDITFFLPLLKRDDYDAALYALAEIGVNTIQLITTQKIQRSWGGQRELERAERILIAAAEQSKNFSFPSLESPISFEKMMEKAKKVQTKLFFDSTGLPCIDVMKQLYENNPNEIMLLVGPEGDLSYDEKAKIKSDGFIFCALTPTILRSAHATALGAGIIRSILSS